MLAPDDLVRCYLPLDYDDKSLSTLMLYSWFNDQTACAELFFASLPLDVRDKWPSSKPHLDSLKAHYRKTWESFNGLAKQHVGEHKLARMLQYKNFAWWIACVCKATEQAGSLEQLIKGLETVETAHEKFKRWFVAGGKTKLPRILNAADSARLLADNGFLQREQRPLLARGALRGAAIGVDGKRVRDIDHAEKLYPDEASRTGLEERSAAFARTKFGEEVRMDLVENWFCESVHKVTP